MHHLSVKNSVADIKNGYIGQRIEVSETEERLYKYILYKESVETVIPFMVT